MKARMARHSKQGVGRALAEVREFHLLRHHAKHRVARPLAAERCKAARQRQAPVEAETPLGYWQKRNTSISRCWIDLDIVGSEMPDIIMRWSSGLNVGLASPI